MNDSTPSVKSAKVNHKYGELRVCRVCERSWLPPAGDNHSACAKCRMALTPESDRLLAALIRVYGPKAP